MPLLVAGVRLSKVPLAEVPPNVLLQLLKWGLDCFVEPDLCARGTGPCESGRATNHLVTPETLG
jgi:hypothetical protein